MSPIPLDSPPHFPLDVSGIAGFIAGNDAISAMTTVHAYGKRRWLGWYNSPGSFHIAMRLHSFAESASVSNIAPSSSLSNPSCDSVHMDPLALFKSDSRSGPKFRAAHLGTVIEETGYSAALFMKECTAYEGKVVPGRKTQPIGVTIADLTQDPAPKVYLHRSSARTPLLASIPISVSIGVCTLSAIHRDWYASALILLGILASGLFCLVLGSADFVFTCPEPPDELPVGDGILSLENDIVLLRGRQATVNTITRGRFTLRFVNEDHCNFLRSCAVLFFIQFLSQLFFIVQASSFGRVMFLTSLGVSAVYNALLSSSDKNKIHQKFLVEKVLHHPTLTRYMLGTQAAAAVFILLVLQPQDPMALLIELLPDDTKVWKRWKAMIVERLHDRGNQSFLFESRAQALDGFTEQQQDLLQLLDDDVRAAYSAYRDYLRIDSL